MNAKVIGTIVGFIFGVVLLWFGPGKAFALVFLMLAGLLIGMIVSGEIDFVTPLAQWLTRRSAARQSTTRQG